MIVKNYGRVVSGARMNPATLDLALAQEKGSALSECGSLYVFFLSPALSVACLIVSSASPVLQSHCFRSIPLRRTASAMQSRYRQKRVRLSLVRTDVGDKEAAVQLAHQVGDEVKRMAEGAGGWGAMHLFSLVLDGASSVRLG
jgi:hypothetical protein